MHLLQQGAAGGPGYVGHMPWQGTLQNLLPGHELETKFRVCRGSGLELGSFHALLPAPNPPLNDNPDNRALDNESKHVTHGSTQLLLCPGAPGTPNTMRSTQEALTNGPPLSHGREDLL